MGNSTDKFISVEGSINLRDFGGYPTETGQTVKKGLLYRCGSMDTIPPHAYEDFAALNVSVICDLRSEEEVESAPTPLEEPFACRVHIPIWPGSSTQFQDTVRTAPPTHEDFVEFMHKVTVEIARDHVHAYEKVMRELVETESGFLVHCTAGKDRTGISAAIILSLLGVNRETIIHDYLISNEATELFDRTRQRMKERAEEEGRPFEVNEEIVKILSGVQEDYLRSAFDEIDQHYGGIHGYFEAIGIKAADETHLREKLLD